MFNDDSQDKVCKRPIGKKSEEIVANLLTNEELGLKSFLSKSLHPEWGKKYWQVSAKRIPDVIVFSGHPEFVEKPFTTKKDIRLWPVSFEEVIPTQVKNVVFRGGKSKQAQLNQIMPTEKNMIVGYCMDMMKSFISSPIYIFDIIADNIRGSGHHTYDAWDCFQFCIRPSEVDVDNSDFAKVFLERWDITKTPENKVKMERVDELDKNVKSNRIRDMHTHFYKYGTYKGSNAEYIFSK